MACGVHSTSGMSTQPAPIAPTLTLNRGGEFALFVDGNAHCGLANAEGFVPCEYALTLCCDASGLDSDGFLVEQFGIHTFFQELPATKLSCELFALNCARDLYKKVMSENPHAKIHGLSLTINPKPEGAPGTAGMTFRWGHIG
jgi:hypothetical protein